VGSTEGVVGELGGMLLSACVGLRSASAGPEVAAEGALAELEFVCEPSLAVGAGGGPEDCEHAFLCGCGWSLGRACRSGR
jgi:hypothetical protein